MNVRHLVSDEDRSATVKQARAIRTRVHLIWYCRGDTDPKPHPTKKSQCGVPRFAQNYNNLSGTSAFGDRFLFGCGSVATGVEVVGELEAIVEVNLFEFRANEWSKD